MNKQKILLLSLFFLPIAIYLFLASGIHEFISLPRLTENIHELNSFRTSDNKTIKIEGKISVLGFLGDKLTHRKTNVFNLHEKIYKKNYGYDQNFQIVMIAPDGTQQQVKLLIEELSRYTKIDQWQFVFGSTSAIKEVFGSFNSPHQLDINHGSDYVFIVDKSKVLRGRVDDKKFGKMYAYNATSVAEIRNKMDDDLKIVLAEYNYALKKNYKVSRRDAVLKINQKINNEE